MRKNLCSILGFMALICAVFFVFSPIEKASASEIVDGKIVEEFGELVETYDLEEVEFVNSEDLNGTLNFETVEEFEAFLKTEEEKEMNDALVGTPSSSLSGPIMFAAASPTPKTYTFKEYTGVSVITSYAKVTRNTKGVVTKVLVWSSQTGVAFPISYTQTTTDYTLNSTKKGGKAYVYGTKSYGVTVGGQGIAYKKSVTYTVPF